MDGNKTKFYKTEIGQIPVDWNVKKIKEIAVVNNNILKYDAPKDYVFYYYDLSAVNKGKISHPCKKICLKDAPSRAKRIFNKYNILMSTVRPNLQGFAFVDFDTEDCICSTGFAVIESKNEYDAMYLYQNLYSHVITIQINKIIVGSNYPAINSKDVENLKVPFPNNENERRKIAKILSTWDKAIELKEKLIEQKKEQKKGLMQKLLTGEIRLAGFEGEWNEKRLSEIFKITSGKSKSSYIEQNGKYFIVDMGAISTEGKLITKKKTNINSDLLNLGDLVMAKDDIGGGNIIGKVVYIDENNKYILGDHVYKLECLEGDSRFLAYLINSYPINMDFRRKATGTAQKGLGRKDVENQIIKVPNYEEQKAISQIITSVDKEIQLQLKELNELKIQKKGLMQLLLTGKVRVQV